MIYFLKAEQTSESVKAGWIKIGTSTCLSERLKQIAVQIGHTPTVLAVLDGSYADERALHKQFGYAREWREWFSPRESLLRLIETEGRPWDGDGPTSLVRIETELATRARYVAAKKGIPLIEFLSEIIRPVVNREFLKAGKDISEGGP